MIRIRLVVSPMRAPPATNEPSLQEIPRLTSWEPSWRTCSPLHRAPATTATIEVQKQTATAPEQLPCPKQRWVVVQIGPNSA